ncbi:3-oxoacyl-ACP reductase [Kitasatospora sp. NE20-6]|uniref:3-oxoacyl-ACP reductase n=1 Tax=Kitasatospora sp. NE20-6 TaxID=2859066 RepID=UPI0034DC247E
MPDLLSRAVSGRAARAVLRRAGVPTPAPLPRHRPDGPAVPGPVRLGGTRQGRLAPALAAVLTSAGAETVDGTVPEEAARPRPAALVLDATGLTGAAGLAEVYAFAHPLVRELAPGGRVVVLGDVPAEAAAGPGGVGAAVAAQALEGFTRSLGKELRGGATCQLLRVAAGGEGALASPLRFLLSPRSAYVSGQVVRVGPAAAAAPADWASPLHGTVAAVTGAARGIGAAVAAVLARDGAHVVCLDLPSRQDALERTAERVGGTAVTADITAPDAPAEICRRLREPFGGVDVFVHNAGVTRDRTLARMTRQEWDTVLDVNLGAVQRITDALLDAAAGGAPVLRDGGALVCTSSVGGIAGNRGQTNYGAAKAGLIGLVQALAPVAAARGIRVNAVAPGFIETEMTARMPLMVREAGRRMNSLGQGGLPVDVAEAVAWLAAPATAGVTGQTLRVCGQSLLGA